MEIWTKAAEWVDADLSASIMPSRAPSMFVAVVPFGLGLFGFGLPEPWREVILSIGITLAVAWLVFWSWRALRYLRSVEYLKRLKAERDSLPEPTQRLIYGPKKKNYTDAKLIAIRNCAIIGALCSCAVVLYIVAHVDGANINDRVSAIVGGLGFFSAICFAFCLWQLATSPRQDARLISWLTPGIQKADPEETGVQLLDPSDPNFDLPTVRYLMRKIRAR